MFLCARTMSRLKSFSIELYSPTNENLWQRRFVGTMEVVLLLEDGEDGEVGITSGGPGDVTGGGGIYLRCVHFCIEPGTPGIIILLRRTRA